MPRIGARKKRAAAMAMGATSTVARSAASAGWPGCQNSMSAAVTAVAATIDSRMSESRATSVKREVRRGDGASPCEQARALHDVLQLAHVAGPAVPQERLLRRRVQRAPFL